MASLDISELYSVHFKRLLKISYSITKDRQLAEDVVQETFIKAIHKIDTVQSTDKLNAWLSVITRRTAIDFIRNEQKKSGIPMEQEMLVTVGKASVQNVEAEVAFSILVEQVKEGMTNLADIYRDVMVLKVKHNLKEQEIAKRLDVNLSSVRTRIFRARKQLKTMFSDQIKF
ncbi:RNA polymerase sigma factor [Salirhabdus salicampi]|uniref:RNA polymerase sigma factor n=1 Tax=Salirhabdus salicampi TaxID=476102 RepID=UPI0020C59F20|nr:RNA polymerase sigma factor [Salirhabdus salicampi]